MQRYKEFTEIIKDENNNNRRRYSTLYYPNLPQRDTDIYIITKRTDRMDLLANQYYGDPRYWVIIARSNVLNDATIRPPIGIRLRIPYPLNPDDIDTSFREKQF